MPARAAVFDTNDDLDVGEDLAVLHVKKNLRIFALLLARMLMKPQTLHTQQGLQPKQRTNAQKLVALSLR